MNDKIIYTSSIKYFKDKLNYNNFDKILIVMRYCPKEFNDIISNHDSNIYWESELAPSKALLKLYLSKLIIWDTYTKIFIQEKKYDSIYHHAINNIKNMCEHNEKILLLCTCKNYNKCHRSILINDIIKNTSIKHVELK